MTTPTELLALAAKIEAALMGGRWLDGDIALAIGAVPDGYVKRGSEDLGAFFPEIERGYWRAPKWSTSLDAAISAIRPGRRWTLDVGDQGAIVGLSRDIWSEVHIAQAKTPPLAVCAANIKERAG